MISKVELSGVNTSKLPVLTNDEKKVLFERIKKGDKAAREEFINGNLKLVLSVVQRFGGRGESPDDLFQIGCVGLIKSIDNFDTTLNVQFSTYAVPMIIGEIRRYLRDNNMVRVSRSVRDLAYRVLQAKEKLSRENGKEPTVEELAKELLANDEITGYLLLTDTTKVVVNTSGISETILKYVAEEISQLVPKLLVKQMKTMYF